MSFSALDSRLLGPLFATPAMRDVFSDRARLASMLKVEAALAEAEAAFGVAPDALADAIRAIDPATLDCDQLGLETALAGVPAIPFVKAVGARLAPELEPFVHKGATTQDVVDTGLVLQMRDGFDLLASDLRSVLADLGRLAIAHEHTPCVGRTYGQQAQPMSFGFKAAVWAAGVAEVADKLPGLRRSALKASLGGPVGTLAGLRGRGPAVADAFAAALDLAPAPISWHARRAAMADVGFWLALLVGSLAKMAADIAHLSSTEIGEVAEPYLPGRGGSSAMPHKRNPVSSTVIMAAQAAAPGHVTTLLTGMAVQGERPAGLWHAEWHALPSLFGLASGALAEAKRLAAGLTVDPGRMLANLDAAGGLLFADAAAAALATKLGRAEAHRLVEDAAGRVRETGRALRDILGEDGAVSGAISAVELDRCFDPAPAVSAAASWVGRATAELDRVSAALHAGVSNRGG